MSTQAPAGTPPRLTNGDPDGDMDQEVDMPGGIAATVAVRLSSFIYPISTYFNSNILDSIDVSNHLIKKRRGAMSRQRQQSESWERAILCEDCNT